MTEKLRIGLVITGGTIGSDFERDGVVRLDPENDELAKSWITGLLASHEHIEFVTVVPYRILSENIDPSQWGLLTTAINRLTHVDKVAGVVVLHGTDTAAWTASALSFSLADVPIPIVVTGSNLPPNQDGSDASVNVNGAILAAQKLGAGIYLAFAGSPNLKPYIHLGCQVRKVRASGQAFFSINREPVAAVDDGNWESIDPYVRPRLGNFSRSSGSSGFDSRVGLLPVFPGQDFSALLAHVEAAGLRGVVVELYASATGPAIGGNNSVVDFMRRCMDLGVATVAAVREAPESSTNDYESAVNIRSTGAFFDWELLPETAVVKLMWALGHADDEISVMQLMGTNFAGEIGSGSQASACPA